MFQNISKAKKLYWSKKTPKERSEYASKIVTIKHSSMTFEEKQAMIINMSKAKKLYWSKKTPKERSDHARKMAIAKHSSMTFQEKQVMASKMLEGRRKIKIPTIPLSP